MCRNIKTLHHFEPPATEEEVRASALQYVRRLTGLKSFSKANNQACEHAMEHITPITLRLFSQLEVHGPPRFREAERQKAIERGNKRVGDFPERLLDGLLVHDQRLLLLRLGELDPGGEPATGEDRLRH